LSVTDEFIVNVGQAVVAAETITITNTLTALLGYVIREQVTVTDSAAPAFIYQLTVNDTPSFTSALTAGIPATASETLTITSSLQAQVAVAVIEQLGIAPSVAAAMTYGLTVSEALSVATSLANFFGVEIDESLSVTDALTGNAAAAATIAEQLTVTNTTTPQLVLRVTAAETFEITTDQLLNAIYNGTIDEAIEITAAYIAPSDGVTTWAMNTRTAAVTEYSNYAFNSFARIGNKYIGASSSGLYELVGDDDDGTDIVAQIKSGFAQWGGSKFSMFKGIYLGVRGAGDFVLKLETGDDKTYTYAVTAQSAKTTKVRTGKGLRARYWSFELISSGQDFDLDTIEFVPLLADRRV
jgi:hypothetical protein